MWKSSKKAVDKGVDIHVQRGACVLYNSYSTVIHRVFHIVINNLFYIAEAARALLAFTKKFVTKRNFSLFPFHYSLKFVPLYSI